MTVQGRTILITGGASGIGLALAQGLHRLGNTVIICGRRLQALEAARERLAGLVVRQCDLTRADSRRELVEWLQSAHPQLDVLINNAGVQFEQDFASGDVQLDAIAAEIQINLTVPILLSAQLLPLLRQSSASAIVNVTSGLAFCPLAQVPVYCATKAALHSFTLSLRHQLSHSSVRVIEIVPPIVRTELGGGFEEHPGGPPVMTPDAFVAQALAELARGTEEVLVGMAASIRAQGEDFFPVMNR